MGKESPGTVGTADVETCIDDVAETHPASCLEVTLHSKGEMI